MAGATGSIAIRTAARAWADVPAVQANGLTLEYEELGRPGDPVMLMVMGLAVQLVFWPDELVERLVAQGFRVIRFDNRDVGLSTKLDHLGMPNIRAQALLFALGLRMRAPYYIDDMARDAEGLLDALGIERAHVVGASMGGMIGQNLAANAPGKVASLTSIMSTTGARNLPRPRARAYKALLSPPAKLGDIEGATQRLMKLLRLIGSQSHPPEEAALRAFCERHARRSHYPPGGARQLLAVAASGDRTEVVKRIKVPTLVIHGDEDPLVRPEAGEATARAVRAGGGQAELRVVRGMGHDFPSNLIPGIVEDIARHCRGAA
jgi:pimeloyl-ACP methyl ester carboxylesterase